MPKGIFVLLLVVVCAVAVCGYGRYHRRGRYGVARYSARRYRCGFKIRHRRFTYGGRRYKLRCGRKRFIRAWRRYYGRYGSKRRCLNKLLRLKYLQKRWGYKYGKYNKYRKINYCSYYKTHRGFTLKGKQFFYNGRAYTLRVGLSKLYRLWHKYFTQYRNVRRVFHVLYSMRIFIKVNYATFYSTHQGFKLRGNRFIYKGIAYTLKCGRSRLFSLWYRYYTLYRSIHRVFSVLYSKQVFVRMSYVTFYRNHRGFTLKGKLFVHNGRTFVLRCARSRFYRLWFIYYQKYRSVTRIFRVLYRKRIFVKISYVNYYRTHGGFRLRGRTFVYNRHTYVLKCGIRSFYRLWHRYYIRYESVTQIFRVLFRKRVFVRINYMTYYRRHNGFTLKRNVFVYNGRTYVLRCGRSRLYRLWYRYYERYQSISKIFKVLYRKRVFVRINFVTYYTQHYGFTLKGKHFVYNRKMYILRCSRSMLYRLWYSYYRKYRSVTRVFRIMFRKRLFVRFNYRTFYRSHRGFTIKGNSFFYKGKKYTIKCTKNRFYILWFRYYKRYQSITRIFRVLYRKRVIVRINYITYYKEHNGFILKGKSFDYNGRTYVLRCGRTKFYRLWYLFYRRYRSITKIFRVLYRKRVFVRINYNSYYRRHDGFILKGKHFVYNGKTYVLKCKRIKLYRLWYRYYRRYQSISKIFRILYHRRIFVRIKYIDYYRTHRGFTLRGKRFIYNGKSYVLNIRRKRFYRLWYRYYIRFRSIKKVFRILYKRRYVICRRGSSRINYVSYYRTHRGFTLKGTKFSYNGDAYNLKISRTKFYRLWYRYYRKYRDVGKTFDELYDKGCFQYSDDDSDVDQEDTDDISSTANLKIVPNSKSTQNTVQNINTYHRFTIRNSKFKYNGKAYKLKCTPKVWFAKWVACYKKLDSVSRCLDKLQGNGFVVPCKGVSTNEADDIEVRGKVPLNDADEEYK